MKARTMAQTTQQKLYAERKYRKSIQDEIIALKRTLSHAEKRGIDADIEAAKAIKELEGKDLKIETLERRGEEIRLELATLRGYVQRINQTDNAHQPVQRQPQIRGESQVEQEPAKYGLPVVGTFKDSDCDPSQINSYMRNRW
tara:strand:- start:1209 stop:1637 length:429 start_codon:yes stop_codon:yes gene_type:complete